MKKICLLRHAKSSWVDRQLQDLERPLKRRGFRDCKLIGRALKEREQSLGTIISSTAIRAQQTIQEVLTAMGDATLDWQDDENLYEFDSRRVLRWIRNIEPTIEEVTLVGHNPAFTDLCNDLADEDIENISTCGFAEIVCDVKNWRDITDGSAQLSFFVTPKMLRKRKSKPEKDWYRY